MQIGSFVVITFSVAFSICLNDFCFHCFLGDDEQSDFFHEPGPACGIPGIIPWWEKEKLTDFEEKKDPVFESILTGSFEHLSTASQRNLKTRLTKLAKVG